MGLTVNTIASIVIGGTAILGTTAAVIANTAPTDGNTSITQQLPAQNTLTPSTVVQEGQTAKRAAVVPTPSPTSPGVDPAPNPTSPAVDPTLPPSYNSSGDDEGDEDGEYQDDSSQSGDDDSGYGDYEDDGDDD